MNERFAPMPKNRGVQDSSYTEAFKANVDRLRKIFSYDKDLGREFGSNTKLLKEAFEIMRKDMEEAIISNDVPVSAAEKDIVANALKTLINGAISEPMTKFRMDISNEFGVLIFNWGGNICKCSQIQSDASFLRRLVSNQMTMLDMIAVSRELTQRMKLELSHRPPSWDLARHYLQSLDEKSE